MVFDSIAEVLPLVKKIADGDSHLGSNDSKGNNKSVDRTGYHFLKNS
jgi:hypothetical protein